MQKSQRKPRVYVTINQKPAYRKKRCIKQGKQTGWDKIHSNQTLPGIHAPKPDTKKREKEQFKYIECRENHPQRTTTRNSLAESPILLRREIPMAWGTTTDSLTPEINPFLYARETKYLTLKDLDSYLILDGWCRSPLSFPTPAWIDKLLPQHSINKTRMLYI